MLGVCYPIAKHSNGWDITAQIGNCGTLEVLYGNISSAKGTICATVSNISERFGFGLITASSNFFVNSNISGVGSATVFLSHDALGVNLNNSRTTSFNPAYEHAFRPDGQPNTFCVTIQSPGQILVNSMPVGNWTNPNKPDLSRIYIVPVSMSENITGTLTVHSVFQQPS